MRLIWQLNGEDEDVVVDVILVVEGGGLLNERHGEPLHDVIRFAVQNPHMVRWAGRENKVVMVMKKEDEGKGKKRKNGQTKLDSVLECGQVAV